MLYVNNSESVILKIPAPISLCDYIEEECLLKQPFSAVALMLLPHHCNDQLVYGC